MNDSLWNHITDRLDQELPGWRGTVEGYGQVAAVEAREQGSRWSDDEIFQGLVLSVLSNNTDWAKVEQVKPELESLFWSWPAFVDGFPLGNQAAASLV